MKGEYLLLMAGCLLLTLPLEFWLRARVYRRPLRLALALLPALVVFYVWDAVAIARNHWTYSPDHTSGVLLPGAVPLEELVFFLVIPICGLLTYEAVGNALRWRSLLPPAADPVHRPGLPEHRLPEHRSPAPVPGERTDGDPRSRQEGPPHA